MKRYLNNNNIIETHIKTYVTNIPNNIYVGTILCESSDIIGIAQWLDEETADELCLVKDMLDMCVLPSYVHRIDSYK